MPDMITLTCLLVIAVCFGWLGRDLLDLVFENQMKKIIRDMEETRDSAMETINQQREEIDQMLDIFATIDPVNAAKVRAMVLETREKFDAQANSIVSGG